jgi:hypothetical protein
MKTKIRKIIILAAALMFVGTGVALAQDRNDRNERNHKPDGKTVVHYEVKKIAPAWNAKHRKPVPGHSRRYAYHRARIHRHYAVPYRRPVPRQKVIYKPVPRDTNVVFKIILK